MKRYRFLPRFTRLRQDRSGLALLEFAFVLPIFLMMGLTGAELTNYITTKMRISQLALHLADNAARMGAGSQLSAKKISELDINDLLTGAGLQAGELNLYTQGRVIVSSLEVDPVNTGKFKIRWQRCRGAMTSHGSSYGTAGQANGSNMDGMGPTGRLVTTQPNNATMFVEVYYEYVPLVGRGSLAPTSNLIEVASMSVRDRRDMTDDSSTTNVHPNGVYKVDGVTASTC
ncbi:TadE/TadG family type IV pilus assembly protein [Sphingomonas sp. ERG5]|uniref:TadE/TadG family type IV pilus assembly protein n=1 Tax=Sphingomonas sp. ERG5 TaxID=1381597 RepID=UPI00054BC0BE|nr:TadE/TadG family type IV pilus assembly protein [Sphingomonas sp. ERG5]